MAPARERVNQGIPMSKLNSIRKSKIVVAFLSLPMIVRFLVVLLAVLLAAFAGVMFSTCIQGLVGGFLGLPLKNEILKFLGIGMGGVLLAIQAVMSYMRAKAMEDAANAQAGATEQQAKANENAEMGLRQERLKNAIEHLGHASDSVRLGGAYELFHLAEETKELRQTAFDMLCAYIRRTTGEAEYREKHESKPSEEIQSLLTLLFVQEHEVFKGLHINLQGSWLNGAALPSAHLKGANLREAHLEGADLEDGHLQRADLEDAKLQGANLQEAHLEGAKFRSAQLQGANLRYAQLQRADLEDAQLQRADLTWAQLQEALFRNTQLQEACLLNAQLEGADLGDAQLQGAYLMNAQLHGANLRYAQLQGTYLSLAALQGAYLKDANLQGVISGVAEPFGRFVERIRRLIGRESDLSIVTFAGGLSQARIDSLAADLSDEGAKRLREKLAPHIDQPESRELPEGSGAITGAYTAEEAEKWITEYERAMSKVPR